MISRLAQAGDALELGLQRRQASGDALGIGLVVPEVGGADLLLQVGDLGPHGVEVEHLLDRRQGRAELFDLLGKVDVRHSSRLPSTVDVPTPGTRQDFSHGAGTGQYASMKAAMAESCSSAGRSFSPVSLRQKLSR